MEKNITNSEINIQSAKEKSFSRFEKNLNTGSALPIFPLTFPSESKSGVLLVGDYIAQDLVKYGINNDPLFKTRWFIVSTTQSDTVPTSCVDVDLNLFTNEKGVSNYLASPAKNVPFSTELGDGHYVDPSIFTPDENIQKKWDIFYASKWYPTKKIELLVETAQLDPNLKIAIYGWPVISERKFVTSRKYRDYIIKIAKFVPNIEIFDSGFSLESISHTNPDNSFVIGSLKKEEMRDRFFRRSRATVMLSESTEAINRSCIEMLCCNGAILIAPTDGGMEKLVNERTGVMIKRSPQGIVEGFRKVEGLNLKPRETFLEKYGKENSNKRLQEIIRTAALKKGININWQNFKYYGGDLWTMPNIYLDIFNQ